MATMELLSQITKSVRDTPIIVNLFNWNEIAKLPLPDSFIIEHANYLNWDILARHQTLSIALSNQFDDLLRKRMSILVLNSQLHSDVFRKYASYMDWETAQKYQHFTPELLRHFLGSLDLLIVLQNQKVPEDIIDDMIRPFVDRKKWAQLRRYLALIFTYQIISNAFVNKYLILENSLYKTPESNSDNGMQHVPQIILVDLPLVIKHQKLDEEFLATFCIPHIKARDEICRSQKLTNSFINHYFDLLNVRKLLKYQRLNEATLLLCCERSIFQLKDKPRVDQILSNINFTSSIRVTETNPNSDNDDLPVQSAFIVEPQVTNSEQHKLVETQAEIDRRLKYAVILLNNQDYSLNLVYQIIDSMPNTNHRHMLWNLVFLRSLAPIGSDEYLGFSNETITEKIIPNVNWNIIAKTKLTPVQLDGIVNLAADYMPWYLYFEKYQLSENHIILLHNANKIDAITWWCLLTCNRETPLSHSFMATYGERKKWWNYISNGATFYSTCLQALDNIEVEGTNLSPIASKADLKAFLNNFVANTKWPSLLQDELLPEWFLRIFGQKQLVAQIPKYWWYITRWQNLTQRFIDYYVFHLDLQMIFTYQTVTEEFIRDKIPFFTPENWTTINTRQNLSEAFRAEFADKLATI
jgi:hypothetical protein